MGIYFQGRPVVIMSWRAMKGYLLTLTCLFWGGGSVQQLHALYSDLQSTNSSVGTDYSGIRGANYIPSYAKTSVQYWRDFRPEVIEREMFYAEKLNLNSVRVWLQYWNFRHDPEGFLGHVAQFVQIASRHGIRPMFVIFDSCFGISPSGESSEQWVSSPGADHLGEDSYPATESYVRALMTHFGKDPRVLMWDVMNEPESTWYVGAPGGKKVIYDFVRHFIRYIQSFMPIQPVTLGANSTHNEEVLGDVDVVSLHSYTTTPEQFRRDIEKTRADAASVGKPFIVSECAAPGWGMDYGWTMQVLRQAKVGYYFWQLMVGSDQFREVGGLVYPDGTARSVQDVSAVSGRPPDLFVQKPDTEGIPIKHQPPGHTDWQLLYWRMLQRFQRTATTKENFSERSTYFRSYLIVKQLGCPIWLERYRTLIDKQLGIGDSLKSADKEHQAFKGLDSLIRSIPALE
jgi:hypothetical protein